MPPPSSAPPSPPSAAAAAAAASAYAACQAPLVEHCGDAYWGDGGDGTGKNMLGRVLVAINIALTML